MNEKSIKNDPPLDPDDLDHWEALFCKEADEAPSTPAPASARDGTESNPSLDPSELDQWEALFRKEADEAPTATDRDGTEARPSLDPDELDHWEALFRKRADRIQEILSNLYQEFSVTKEISVREQLSSEIEKEQINIDKWLVRHNPFKESQIALQNSEDELEAKNIATIDQLERDFQHFRALSKQTSSTIGEDYWLSEVQKLKENREYQARIQACVKKDNSKNQESKKHDLKEIHEDQVICRKLLLQQWRKLLDEQIAKWEIEAIQRLRQKLLNRLEEWLKNLQLLAEALDDLSIEPGLLFDLSKGNLSLSNIEQLKKWAEYISKDKGVKELCDMLGRLRHAEKTRRQELVKNTLTVIEYVPDINSKEEIVGVYLGKDIEHAIPQEIALLSDDETATLFDMKFVEGRLMCFEMEGTQKNSHEIEEECVIEVEEEEKLGPMIICVDTSSSMQGSPETLAKAVTLFIATRAVSQKRDCLLINFSTSIETLDLSGKIGIVKAIEFLQRSFYGGTDSSPAFESALEMMSKKKYKQSDLLIISDFIMDSLSESLYEKISTAQKNKNHFYSLSIGNLFLSKKLQGVFDNQWVYNPSTSNISSIQNVGREIIA